MHLHSPTSAILSAVIFNAVIIPLLIPVALRGVRYRALGADALLRCRRPDRQRARAQPRALRALRGAGVSQARE